jgi:hypothetical protein
MRAARSPQEVAVAEGCSVRGLTLLLQQAVQVALAVVVVVVGHLPEVLAHKAASCIASTFKDYPMKYQIVENGVVVNAVIADAPLGPNWIQSDTAGIGWIEVNGVLTAPVIVTMLIPPVRTLTHLQFRRRFTSVERELSDELEATFESNPTFTVDQKRMLRSGYKDFNAAIDVHLDDAGISPMLALYVAIGILTANRPAEILA